MDHIWTIENWEKNIDFMEEGHRTGFRLRFDSGINPEVGRACKEFAAFLRKEYFFPLRVVAYIKIKRKYGQRIGINPDRDGASGNKICKICVRRLCRNKGASLSADRMKKGKEK